MEIIIIVFWKLQPLQESKLLFYRVLIPSHAQTREGGKVQKLKSLFLSPVAFKLEVDNQNKKKKILFNIVGNVYQPKQEISDC